MSLKKLTPPIIILSALIITFLPVILAHNYLRQDDLMWEIWPGMKMSDFGYLYYNTVFQLVRPLCMLSFYITDLISIDIYHAVYIRAANVFMIGILGILLYYWQLKFNPHRMLAITFAIAAFTLPAYQVFAATGNYFLILTALLLTFGAMFSWQQHYFRLGNILFFLSLLEYPLSSMYAWTLLAIFYLNMLISHPKPEKLITQGFFKTATLRIMSLMALYYIVSRIFHKIFKVHLDGRATLLDTHGLFERFTRIFDVLNWHAHLWRFETASSLIHSPIWIIIAIFLIALTLIHRNKKQSHILSAILILFTLFFLAYAPILATPEVILTFRYTLATMPLLLYILFWSIQIISQYYTLQKIATVLFTSFSLFGMSYANFMLAEKIVGPHEQDFLAIQTELKNKVIPLLKENKKISIHAIACDKGTIQTQKTFAKGFEYSMRFCHYQQQVIGVILHSLTKAGIDSNYHRHNQVIYHPDEIIVKDIPWGNLIVHTSQESELLSALKQSTDDLPIVTIDTRKMLPYQPFSFYKKWLT